MTTGGAPRREAPILTHLEDGRAGNDRQVEAIMQALLAPERWEQIANGHDAQLRRVEATPRRPWRWVSPPLWPLPGRAFDEHVHTSLKDLSKRDILIGAGRRVSGLSYYAKRWSKGAAFTVQILDPRIDPAHFDLVIAPEHDGLTAPNVVSTLGSVVHVSDAAIAEAKAAFPEVFADTRRSAIVILGGDSKTHTFTKAAATRLEAQMRALAAEGWHLRLTTSRRTPAPIAAAFRKMAGEIGAEIWAGPADGANPYLAWLLAADAALVTEDSANMLSDAAWHGLPVHIARLEGRSDKFDRLHKSFIDKGIARWFSGKLDAWEYAPLREAERVADVIVETLLARER